MYKLLLPAIFIANIVNAQRYYGTNHNVWGSLISTITVAPKWSIHLEAVLRRAEYGAAQQQLLLRTGLNYTIAPNANITAGYCYVATAAYGVLPAKSAFPEHRLWQQLLYKNNIGIVAMQNRFRLEQRWVNLPVQVNKDVFAAGDAVYTNRLRYMVKAAVPLRGKTIVDKSWYAVLSNEAFVNFGKNVKLNIFDQNRAFAGLGYKIPKYGNLEFGYMNHLLFKSNGVDVEHNHTYFVGLINTVDYARK